MATPSNPASSFSSTIPMSRVYFFVFFLLEGLQRVSGIFFLETKESLGSSRLLAAIPFALSKATAHFAGVALECWKKKLTPGKWIIVGSLISATGIGFCFLTTDIIWWSIYWGILFGTGIGIASPTLVKELKEQNNTVVTSSLKLTGSSFGCIILPFTINTLITQYGLNGCYGIFSGLILNCIPLVLLAIYKINFHLPKPKWRLGKKSKRYQMSVKQMFNDKNTSSPKSNAIKVLSKESFNCSLESDTLHKISESEENSNKHSEKDMECIDIFKPITEAKRDMVAENINRSEFLCAENDLKDIICPKREEFYKEKMSELVTDIKNYEKSRMMFEESFSHSDAMSESPVESSLKNDFFKDIERKSEKKNHDGGSSAESSVEDINPNSGQDSLPDVERTHYATEKNISNVKNGNPKGLRLNIPLEIKVHVVECTVTTSDEYLETPPINQILPPVSNGYRRHSNSLISGHYDNIDFTKMLQHKNSKPTPLHKLECHLTSRMFLISEDDESEFGNRNSFSSIHEFQAVGGNHSSKKTRNIAQIFYELAKPSYLVIIYTSVTFDFTLALLLIMSADFAKDNAASRMGCNFVLLAFGLGGIVGKLSFSFWGNRLLVDGSHAATAVIFLLNGLVVAGILWSTNVCWLSGFFGLLGFIESGISLTFPRFISDYIQEKAERVLSWTCRGVSGIAILGIPYAIGFYRDDIGEYDGLLQVTSCLSVLCAVLCYFLPRITKRLNHMPDQL